MENTVKDGVWTQYNLIFTFNIKIIICPVIIVVVCIVFKKDQNETLRGGEEPNFQCLIRGYRTEIRGSDSFKSE